MKAFHGTKADNLESILKHGLCPNKPANWLASLSEVYLWSTEHVDGDTAEYRHNEAFRLAAESAEFCLWDSKDCRRMVIEVDVTEFQLDESCENMAEQGAICCDRILPHQIKAIYIDSEDLCFYRAYFASLRHERYLAKQLDLTHTQQLMVNAIANNQQFQCEIFELLSDLVWNMREIPLLANVA